MTTNTKNALVIAGEFISEFIIGASVGVVLGDVAKRCNTFERIVLMTGSTIATVAAGRAFGKGVFKFTNEHLGTNIDVM